MKQGNYDKESKDSTITSSVEEELRKRAKELPGPQMGLLVSPVMAQKKKKTSLWMAAGRVAVLVIALLAIGGGTAFAASGPFRQMVIHFFTDGMDEELPLSGLAKTEENPKETEEGFSPVTVGDVTFLLDQKLDEHFSVSYFTSPFELNILSAPSGNLLFYSREEGEEGCTYYQVVDGSLQILEPEVCQAEGSITLQGLPGVMGLTNRVEKDCDIVFPEMTFTVEWQQYGEEILLLDNNRYFDIGSTFGGSKNGEPIDGEYDGMFSATAWADEDEWVQVLFFFDRVEEYQYPFLFNIRTGETKDPLAEIDLSAYACITQLAIQKDMETATALAGEDRDHLRNITIDLQTGMIEEEQALLPPVLDCYTFFATSDHTVFYAVGTQKKMSGYLYDTDSGVSTKLFSDVAWGYTWEYGLFDEYVQLIGGNYAVYYREPENEVYLWNLSDGSKQLLEGIPANHDVGFFWNYEQTVLSVSLDQEGKTTRLAFYIPGQDHAQYFDRVLPENIEYANACWYGEYGYLISEESKDGKQHYLCLYQYTP